MNAINIGEAASRAGIADYHFLRLLGVGNNGIYYLAARPERLRIDAEQVAVKVLTGASSQDTFRRATRELAAFAAVNSPYLVTLYDAGQQGSDLYYSMEYLPEGSLSDTAEPLGPRRIISAVADAARAAHALHEAGIAHNDITPGNVMLHPGGAKLSDLGLSRELRPGLTITGMGGAASIEFLDPMLIRGAQPSRATDIFALGATLHRALSGEGLYGDVPANDAMLAMRRVLSKPPVISALIAPDVAAVIAAAISPDLTDRPSTALGLARKLDDLPSQAT